MHEADRELAGEARSTPPLPLSPLLTSAHRGSCASEKEEGMPPWSEPRLAWEMERPSLRCRGSSGSSSEPARQ